MKNTIARYKRHWFPPEIIQHAALKLQGGGPRNIVTDKLRSYGVAHRELMPDTTHNTLRYANNVAEQSNEATRGRERVMRRFKFWSKGYFMNKVRKHGDEALLKNYVKNQGCDESYQQLHVGQLQLL